HPARGEVRDATLQPDLEQSLSAVLEHWLRDAVVGWVPEGRGRKTIDVGRRRARTCTAGLDGPDQARCDPPQGGHLNEERIGHSPRDGTLPQQEEADVVAGDGIRICAHSYRDVRATAWRGRDDRGDVDRGAGATGLSVELDRPRSRSATCVAQAQEQLLR